MAAIWDWLVETLRTTPWGDFRGFWLTRVFSDRLLIVYCLPLAPILLLAPPRALRPAIILTGLAFLTYLFGLAYAAFWLLACIGFYFLAERWAREVRRTDVWRWGPPLAAIGIIAGWFLLTQTFGKIEPLIAASPRFAGWQEPLRSGTAWLREHAPILFALGSRGWSWEPRFRHDEPYLLESAFVDAHLIGTAYLVVRLLHYFAEIRRGGIGPEQRSLTNFLAWLCYAPGVMQGPIGRYVPFQDEMDTCHERRDWAMNLPAGLARIAWGLGKAVLATSVFGPLLWYELGFGASDGPTLYKHPERIGNTWLLYFGQAIQIFWLYLLFSGYCDISAGVARWLGYRQAENFRWVWLATSLRDFWRRWHITLSSILRDYVYIALGGNRRHVTFNLCLTFAICGLWHRPLPKLALWGVLMGVMLAINQRWAEAMGALDAPATERRGWMRAAAGARRAWLRLRPLPQVAAWLLTMHAFNFSLLLFFGGEAIWRVPAELFRRIAGGGG